MKAVRCRVQLNLDVIANPEKIVVYVRENHWPDYDYFEVFGPWIFDEKLYGISRKVVNGDQLDIFFILKDEHSEEFKNWLASLENFQGYIVPPGPEIMDYDELAIRELYNDENSEWYRDDYIAF